MELAGLLVERHTPDTAVVGVGLNVFNHPEAASPALRDATIRLADLAPLADHDLDSVAALVLRALAHAHAILLAGDFPRIAADLNRSWGEPRLVALTLAGRPAAVIGLFTGIDDHGHLRLRDRVGRVHTYDAVQVAHLRELEG